MSTVRCLEVKTFGKNKDAAGSGTDDYSTVETSFQPSAGTAAEVLIYYVPSPSFCLTVSLPTKRRKG